MNIKLYPGQKAAYQIDVDGMYLGESPSDPDPENPGKWLIPAGCVETAPPKVTFSKWPKWNGWKWQLVDKPE